LKLKSKCSISIKVFLENIFSTRTLFCKICNHLFEFQEKLLQLGFAKACTFSIPINGRYFWAFQLVTLFHMIPKIIIAIIAPFPPWISGLNEILRIVNNFIVLY